MSPQRTPLPRFEDAKYKISRNLEDVEFPTKGVTFGQWFRQNFHVSVKGKDMSGLCEDTADILERCCRNIPFGQGIPCKGFYLSKKNTLECDG